MGLCLAARVELGVVKALACCSCCHAHAAMLQCQQQLYDARCKCSLACEEPHLICVQTSSRAQAELHRRSCLGDKGWGRGKGGSLSRAACNAHKLHLHLNPDSIGRLLYGPRAQFADALCIAVSSLRAAWPFSQIVYGHSRLRKDGAEGRGRAQVTGHEHDRAKVDQQSGAKDPITISRIARETRDMTLLQIILPALFTQHYVVAFFYRVLFLMHNFQSTRADVGNTMRGF